MTTGDSCPPDGLAKMEGVAMRALMMIAPSVGTDRTEIREVDEPRPGPGEVVAEGRGRGKYVARLRG
jgi:hypothetical protein